VRLKRDHLWLLFAAGDAALCAGLAALFGWPLLYALAPLSFPLWAWVDSRPEGRAWLDRFSGQ
jgi:hypothetical protein